MSRLATLCVPAVLLLALPGCSSESSTDSVSLNCSVEAPAALRACVADYSARVAACYADTGAPCADNDATLAGALDTLQTRVAGSCSEGDFVNLSPEAVSGRLRNACSSEAGSIAWRTYGGPQGSVWSTTSSENQTCLVGAHASAARLVDDSLATIGNCLTVGDSCDLAKVASDRAALAATAQSEIEAQCSNLDEVIAISPATYVARAGHQVDCLTATGNPDTGGLPLDCGPSHAQFDAPRGEWMQVVVDGDKWGTLCGDGTPYAFQIRLAPEGEALDRLVIGLQGGGVCLFEDDCTSRMETDAGLFNAMDDQPLSLGIASNDPQSSPFANWTKVYLPYCNQDVFAGGGVDEDLGGLTLPRYGSVNARAAVQMVRDVLWKKMDAAGGAGFRPDEVVTLFGGWSAGGYGTLYNYHWFLDDLQWPRTAAFPDAGLALDNGETLGVKGLGLLKIPAWGMLPNLPPYCFAGDCAAGSVLMNALSPRLKRVPEQQMLLLSNPFDETQQGDAFFGDTPSFINSMRETYCSTKDLPGIQYYLTSVSDTSVHVVSIRPSLWEGTVDGEAMRDWFSRAVTDPDSIVDRAEEGDFVTAFPGVDPYPCEVAP